MDLQSVLQWLTDNRYVLASKEKGYVLSKTFQDDVKKIKRDGVPSDGYAANMQSPAIFVKDPILQPAGSSLSLIGAVDWSFKFMQFIKDAQVPARLEDNRRNEYAANKYSEDGMKAFRKAIESGVDYGTLVRSTMLYYKSSLKFKKAVGNYFAQGDWRSDYEALRAVAESGDVNKIDEHVKQETKSNEYTPYRLG